MSSTTQVLVISYESFRAHADLIAAMKPPLDLLMLDEGHRIKNVSAKISKALSKVMRPSLLFCHSRLHFLCSPHV
jgi:SNF2 family DNA or RNA helicase